MYTDRYKSGALKRKEKREAEKRGQLDISTFMKMSLPSQSTSSESSLSETTASFSSIFCSNIHSNLPEIDRLDDADKVLIQDSSNKCTNVEPEVEKMNNSGEGSIMTNTSDIKQSGFEGHFNNEYTTSNTVFYFDFGNISFESPSQGNIEKYVTSYHFAKPLFFPKDVSNQKFLEQIFNTAVSIKSNTTEIGWLGINPVKLCFLFLVDCFLKILRGKHLCKDQV